MSTAADAALDVMALRAKYPALDREVAGKRLVYLDSACTALKPKRVADRLADFYANWGGCGGKRSTHLLSQQVEEWFLQSRRAAALFLRADGANEIVFTSGTTEAANLVARSFSVRRRRRRDVVITDLEQQRGRPAVPGGGAPRREIDLKILPDRRRALGPEPAREALVTSDRTALLAITHASNVDGGGVVPVAEAAKLDRWRARARGSSSTTRRYLGTHQRGRRPRCGADFVAFSGHKARRPVRHVGVFWVGPARSSSIACCH